MGKSTSRQTRLSHNPSSHSRWETATAPFSWWSLVDHPRHSSAVQSYMHTHILSRSSFILTHMLTHSYPQRMHYGAAKNSWKELRFPHTPILLAQHLTDTNSHPSLLPQCRWTSSHMKYYCSNSIAIIWIKAFWFQVTKEEHGSRKHSYLFFLPLYMNFVIFPNWQRSVTIYDPPPPPFPVVFDFFNITQSSYYLSTWTHCNRNALRLLYVYIYI